MLGIGCAGFLCPEATASQSRKKDNEIAKSPDGETASKDQSSRAGHVENWNLGEFVVQERRIGRDYDIAGNGGIRMEV